VRNAQRKKGNSVMTHMDLKARDHTSGITSPGWIEGYDGKTHYASVLMALVPAAFILAGAVALLVIML
jgi:hypothetical protein